MVIEEIIDKTIEKSKKFKFHVTGLRCGGCKIIIEDVLQKQEFVKKAILDFKAETVEIETFVDFAPKELSIKLNQILPHDYRIFVENEYPIQRSDGTIWKAIPIGLAVLTLFLLLQKTGILNFGVGGITTPFTALIIGLIASVSSCLAIVGGLVLSLSAKVSQDGGVDKKIFTLFHAGRIISFAIFGGILGLIGETIGVSYKFSTILGLVAAVIMIILGLNLAGVFRKKFTIQNNIFSFFKRIEHATLTPLLIGVGTFFLPCGFTQSMQFVALSSGSFFTGLLTMLAFALGTFPMLALLSFGSSSFSKSQYASLFFKSAGVVVVGLGLFAFLTGLVAFGLISPIFNF